MDGEDNPIYGVQLVLDTIPDTPPPFCPLSESDFQRYDPIKQLNRKILKKLSTTNSVIDLSKIDKQDILTWMTLLVLVLITTLLSHFILIFLKTFDFSLLFFFFFSNIKGDLEYIFSFENYSKPPLYLKGLNIDIPHKNIFKEIKKSWKKSVHFCHFWTYI